MAGLSRSLSLSSLASFPLPRTPFVSLPVASFLFFPAAVDFGFGLEAANQRQRHRLCVQKIAEATPAAALFIEIPAPCLSEIRDGTEFYLHLATIVEPSVHDLHRIAGVFFVEELAIHVTNHVIAEIVANMQLVDPTKLGEFQKHVFVKSKKVFEGFHLLCPRIVVVAFVAAALGTRHGLFEFRHAYRMAVKVFY